MAPVAANANWHRILTTIFIMVFLAINLLLFALFCMKVAMSWLLKNTSLIYLKVVLRQDLLSRKMSIKLIHLGLLPVTYI